MRAHVSLVVAILAAASVSAAAEAPTDAPVGFNMEPPQPDLGLSPQIIGGRKVAHPDLDYPATLKFNGGAGPCTSTVIGPQVILTAAHCVLPGQKGTVTIGGSVTNVTCDHHTGYDSDYKLDIALCRTDSPVVLPGVDSPYETLADALTLVSKGSPALLLGYGCRQTLGGGPAGVLYEGDTTVAAIDSNDPYIETRGGAAVCYGDSGGAAFFAISQRERRVFGINSQGDLLNRSLLSAVAQIKILTFIKDWRTLNGVQVCGLDPIAHCHA